MSERVYVTEFARRLGVSPPAVFQAMKRGRLRRSLSKNPKGRTLVDVDLGKREWLANSDERKNVNGGAGGKTPTGNDEREAEPSDEREADRVGGKTLNQIRAIHLTIAAKNEQLDFEQRKGRLADVSKVKAEWFLLVRRARDRLLLIPNRIAGECAAETDQKRVHTIIEREIQGALVELTSDGRRIDT